MQLYNRIDKKVLREKVLNSPKERTTISFYKYHQIKNPQLFRDYLFIHFSEVGVLGRIYLAHEGINAQISVLNENLHEFKQKLDDISFLNGIRLNYAIDNNGKSFIKLVIKVRHKIVADGLNDKEFDVTNCGKHLKAEEFNELTSKEDTILIDMRNHYESEVGHFKGAILPDVDSFREELPVVEEIIKGKQDKHIVMYCTGGIRCEKASAYFKHKGYPNVYQLEGGIIEYARQVKNKGLENKFIGKNFVFDERLGERISEDIIASCHQCGEPCDDHTNCKNEGCHLLFIQCKKCAEKYEGCCSQECNDIIKLPLEKQKELRKGIDKGQMIFKKGRAVKQRYQIN